MFDQRRSFYRRYFSRVADAMTTVHRTRVSPEAPPGDRRLQARRRTGELSNRNGARERRTPQKGAGRTREVRSRCSMERKFGLLPSFRVCRYMCARVRAVCDTL